MAKINKDDRTMIATVFWDAKGVIFYYPSLPFEMTNDHNCLFIEKLKVILSILRPEKSNKNILFFQDIALSYKSKTN